MSRVPHSLPCSPALLAGLVLLASAVPVAAQDATAGPDTGAPYDLDWGVGLRGAYAASTTTGTEIEGIVAPEFTFTQHGESDTSSVSGDGAFALDTNRNFRIDTLHGGAATTIVVDPYTTLNGTLDLSLNQLKATDTSLPAGTIKGPLEFTGDAQGGVTRNLGHFDATATLKGSRLIEGPTMLSGGTLVDNTDQNYWAAEGDLRLGYELTPLISVFTEADRTQQKLDIADPTLLVFLDNSVTTLRGGVSYSHDSSFSGELSAGEAFIDYADPSLTDRTGWVVDGKVSFAPDPTLGLDGALETKAAPSTNTPGDTDVAYTLTGAAHYQVNPWLTLRGSAGFSDTMTLGTGATDVIVSAGAGIDVQTSRHAVWSADYLFTRDTATGKPVDDTHALTVGVKFKR